MRVPYIGTNKGDGIDRLSTGIQHGNKTKEWRRKLCALCLYVFYS